MSGSSKLTAFLICACVLAPVILIYWFAGWLVDIMTPRAREALPDIGFKPDDMQAIAFSAVGAFILYVAVRETVGILVILPRLSPNDGAYIVTTLLRALTAWICGLYLLAGAPAMRRWVGRMRRTGQDRPE